MGELPMQGVKHGPSVKSYSVAFSYERGALVQQYFTSKKTHLPRTLP